MLRPLALVLSLVLFGCPGPVRDGSVPDAAQPVAQADPGEAVETGEGCIPTPADWQHPPMPPGGCGLDTDSKSVLITSVHANKLVMVHADGSVSVPHTFGDEAPWPETYAGHQFAVASGPYVAAAAFVQPKGGGEPDEVQLEVVITDSNGQVLTIHRRVIPYGNAGNTLHISGDGQGLFAVHWRLDKTNGLTIVTAWGAVHEMPEGLDPIAAVDPARFIATTALGKLRFRWDDLCSKGLLPMARPGFGLTTAAKAWGSRLTYAVIENPEVIVESLDRVVRIPLELEGPIGNLDLSPAGWMLISKEGLPTAMVDLNTEAVRDINYALPDGMRRMTEFGPGFGVHSPLELRATSAGGLALGLRNDSQGGLYISETGDSWTQIGHPVAHTSGVHALEAGGSYLVAARGLGRLTTDYTGAPPEALTGQSLQLVRPESDVTIIIHDPAAGGGFVHDHLLSKDGLCGACWTGAVLHLYDAALGKTTDLDLSDTLETGFTYRALSFTAGTVRLGTFN